MFYVLFRYLKGEQEKDYQRFRLKKELLKFVEEKKGEIEIDKIIEATREFKFRWALQLDEISSPIPRGLGTKKEKGGDSQAEEIKPTRGRGRPQKEKPGPKHLDQEPEKEGDNLAEELAETPKESSEIEAEEEGNDLKDEHKEKLWQLEVSLDSQGRKKRRCWYPYCKKWFVIKYKGQHYCRDTCRHQHQK